MKALLVAALLMPAVASADPEWKTLSDRPYIRQRVWDNGVMELHVEATLAAPLEAVQSAVLDCPNAHRFMPYMKECRFLTPVGADGTQLLYARLSPPLVSNRDSVSRIATAISDGNFKQSWTSEPDAAPEVPGVYRIRVNSGSWTGLAMGTKTRLIYHMSTDPGPGIPGFLLGTINRQAITDLLKAIEAEAARRALTTAP